MSAEYIYNGNVIDFEASGLGAESYPIEVGLVLEDGSVYHSLICPQEDWRHWSAKAERLHGITRADITRYGKSAKQVCLELNHVCGKQTLFSDCWVKDTEWMSKLFQAGGVQPTFHISPMEYCVPETYLEDWGHAKAIVSKAENVPLHRALSDAFVIKTLLDKVVLGLEPEDEIDIGSVNLPRTPIYEPNQQLRQSA